MTRRPLLAVAALAVIVLGARTSSAQQLGPFIGGAVRSTALPSSANNGLQLGNGSLLHLGIGAEGGYDTNIFYNDADRVSATVLRVTPFLDLSNATRSGEVPSGLFYDVRAALTYREYITNAIDSSRLRAFVPSVSASVEHNSGGTLAFGLMEAFSRSEDAPYTRDTSQGLIIRDNNVASLQLRWSPGGGRLQGLLRYTNTIDVFETAYLKRANSIGHEGMFDMSWRWLPKTALYFQVRQGYISYLNDTGSGATSLGDKSSSFPLRAVLGIRGLITEKTSVALAVGYQNAFYSSGATTAGFLGSTTLAGELVVLPLVSTRLALGAHHDFQNSVIGNFYYDDGVYLSLAEQTTVGIIAQLWGSYDYRRYNGVSALGGTDERKDNVVQAGAMVDYFLKTWAYAGLSYSLNLNRSDYQVMNSSLTGASYTKHQVFARLGLTY
jgi:hypothetical protein